MDTYTRADITCPRDGELIPLDKYSVSKFSAKLHLVYCPRCTKWHQFEVAPADPRPSEQIIREQRSDEWR